MLCSGLPAARGRWGRRGREWGRWGWAGGGVGAFLMSEFRGVPYWDVVIRGFALAFVYYVSLALAVYLLCVRLLPHDAVTPPGVSAYQQMKTSIFFLAVVFLMAMMGW